MKVTQQFAAQCTHAQGSQKKKKNPKFSGLNSSSQTELYLWAQREAVSITDSENRSTKCGNPKELELVNISFLKAT